uniref:Uncharacterized protein n=1 Tax=Melanopsichium pennsylvanicum 4 TaxID=1398559 RepID=A0A077QZ32_9BASI|nr:uncharacterized protein BN887_06029 [Melanopsichium pennsylvanicum 4]
MNEEKRGTARVLAQGAVNSNEILTPGRLIIGLSLKLRVSEVTLAVGNGSGLQSNAMGPMQIFHEMSGRDGAISTSLVQQNLAQ